MASTTIRIAQPCHERWDAMMPTADGRHCAACAKTVVDFTHKTDAEILAHLARAGSGTCGRFQAEQLARPLGPPLVAHSRWRTWLGAVLAAGGVLGTSRTAAQTNAAAAYPSGPVPVANGVAAGGASAASGVVSVAAPVATFSLGESPVIKGVVRDGPTGEGLPGVTVLVKGTVRGTSTNADGEFILKLLPGEQTVQLEVSSIGYTSQQQLVTLPVHSPLSIAMKPSTTMMGEVVLTSYSPYPWHPRAFYNWSKYWLSRPFRR